MTKEEAGRKIRGTYDKCAEKIKKVPVYFEKSTDTLVDFFKDKKTKFIIAVSLFVQAVTFIVLFFVYWNKKKSFAAIMAALSAASAAAGSMFLISSLDEDENGRKTLLHLDGDYYEEDSNDEISVELVDDGDDDELRFGEEDA